MFDEKMLHASMLIEFVCECVVCVLVMEKIVVRFSGNVALSESHVWKCDLLISL